MKQKNPSEVSQQLRELIQVLERHIKDRYNFSVAVVKITRIYYYFGKEDYDNVTEQYQQFSKGLINFIGNDYELSKRVFTLVSRAFQADIHIGWTDDYGNKREVEVTPDD